MKSPLVSIIFPCYNAMEYLDEAIESILKQSYSNFELITIDDGSSDGTLSFLKQVAQKDARVRVIENEHNMGLIHTLNKGINLAKGDYIARMDADDICSPNRIEVLMKHLHQTGCSIISCNFNYINEKGAYVRGNHLKAISQEQIKFSSFLFTPIGHAMLVGKKQAFIDHPYKKENTTLHTEDYELWSRMLRNNVTFSNLDQDLYSIRINSNSVSRKFETLQEKNFLRCAHEHYLASFNDQPSIDLYSIVVNRFETITPELCRQAFAIIKGIQVKLEIPNEAVKSIINCQKLDIYIQAIKQTSRTHKFYFLTRGIAFCLLHVFSKKFRKYLFRKFA